MYKISRWTQWIGELVYIQNPWFGRTILTLRGAVWPQMCAADGRAPDGKVTTSEHSDRDDILAMLVRMAPTQCQVTQRRLRGVGVHTDTQEITLARKALHAVWTHIIRDAC